MKVPATVATGLICTVLGIGLGALGMANVDLVVPRKKSTAASSEVPPVVPPTTPNPPPSGPSPTYQLVGLVAKLDLLTQKPLTVTLTDEDRVKLAEQLKGLGDLAPLNDDEIKKRLEAVLEIVKDDREALEAAGYSWPGDTRIRPRGGAPNPFTEVDNAAHLKALQDRLTKSKGD